MLAVRVKKMIKPCLTILGSGTLIFGIGIGAMHLNKVERHTYLLAAGVLEEAIRSTPTFTADGVITADEREAFFEDFMQKNNLRYVGGTVPEPVQTSHFISSKKRLCAPDILELAQNYTYQPE